MNSFLVALLLCLVCAYPAETLRVSSKLDFGQKSSYSDAPVPSVRRPTPLPPLISVKQEEDGKIKPLTTVCIKSKNCESESKSISQNAPKADVLVQVISDSEIKNSTNKDFVDVPDVPVVVGTKGVSYYSGYPNSGITRSYDSNSIPFQANDRPEIPRKVYVPLFGSSVLEVPVTSRNYRSAAVGGEHPLYRNRNYYSSYNNKGVSYRNNPAFISTDVRSYGIQAHVPFNPIQNTYPNWKVQKPKVEETLVCTCHNQPPHYHFPTPDWKNFIDNPVPTPHYSEISSWMNFINNPTTPLTTSNWNNKKPGIDDKLGPLD